MESPIATSATFMRVAAIGSVSPNECLQRDEDLGALPQDPRLRVVLPGAGPTYSSSTQPIPTDAVSEATFSARK